MISALSGEFEVGKKTPKHLNCLVPKPSPSGAPAVSLSARPSVVLHSDALGRTCQSSVPRTPEGPSPVPSRLAEPRPLLLRGQRTGGFKWESVLWSVLQSPHSHGRAT